ncbi:S-layer protein [Methanococcus voltae]|jgi:S-layer protein (TIGR01564 family)|uniref:S-layer protein n=1 Tax=Methanococcus voltae (strain ATCC BAA-1334 / A3) TaxID=456320 RepID=D7DR47_METV3|nr:S-layer protein [Methanococcus voltae]MCS3900984.1 S-layer protein (TIGR01564 family) [Methanococcus voltae]
MAMSLKKIGAIAAGSAMVASALATGVFAVEKIGDVEGFKVIENGEPTADIVVGSTAAAADVVSAANVAAKIGSMMFTEGEAASGSAKLTVKASAESDDANLKEVPDKAGLANAFLTTVDDQAFLVAAADSDYADGLINDSTSNPAKANLKDGILFTASKLAAAESLGDLSTLSQVKDIDPSDWYSDSATADRYTADYYDQDGDAVEMVMATVTSNGDGDSVTVKEDQVLYASISYDDDNEDFRTSTMALKEGNRLPFLGEEYALVKLDTDDDIVYLGKEVFDGVLKEGDTYSIGDGYELKVVAILTTGATPVKYKVSLQLLKDGKVVAEKFDIAEVGSPLKMVYTPGNIGIVVNQAWENVGGDYGYASTLITNNLVALEVGEEYIPDWQVVMIEKTAFTDGSDIGTVKLELADDKITKANTYGIGLQYVGDDEDNFKSGKSMKIAKYAEVELDDEDKETTKLNAFFSMDETKEATLAAGQKVTVLNSDITLSEVMADAKAPVAFKAPLAVLDSEVSLAAANKKLILVGGPVANALTKELADAGKVEMTNESPATLAVVAGAANGNDVLVVAGGDRAATAEAANALINML